MASAAPDSSNSSEGPASTPSPPDAPPPGSSTEPPETDPGSSQSVCLQPEQEISFGLFECANRIVHRVTAAECESPPGTEGPVARPRASLDAGVVTDASVDADAGTDASTTGQDYFSVCLYDHDCTERANGRCHLEKGGSDRWTYCSYSCSLDSDCGSGQVCECRGQGGVCISATCANDADCPAAQVCARFDPEDSCYQGTTYACTTPTDECHTAEDCDTDDSRAFNCEPQPEGGATCEEPCYAVDGRPLLIDGAPRVAALLERADWLPDPEPGARNGTAADLPADIKARLGAHWARVAQMEHASIAAFARFALQLLALGAPADLLTATHDAMRDETLHARLAFGLASRYLGACIGPARLDCSDALTAWDLGSVALGTLLEGCIGETMAALDARDALARCSDPTTRSVLALIVRDETRHAELAWRFIHWALQREPALAQLLMASAERELERSLAAHLPVMTQVNGSSAEGRLLAAHGMNQATSRARLHVDVLRHVVLPCLQAMTSTTAVDADHPMFRGNNGATAALPADSAHVETLTASSTC